MISSTANVAMPAASPERRISGSADEERERRRPRRAASTSDGTLPIVLSRSNRKRSGSTPVFDSTGIVSTPLANAPDRDEADLAEREDARVADEDVDRDDDRDRDDAR